MCRRIEEVVPIRAPNAIDIVGFFNVPVLAPTRRPTFFYGFSEKPPHLVAFYDTLGKRRTHSRLHPGFDISKFSRIQFQLIFPLLYMLFPRISKINVSNRTRFYQMRCIKITHCINDDIKNVGFEKFSWSWKFKIIFKYLRCWIDVFLFQDFVIVKA